MTKPRLTKKQQIAAVQAAIREADEEALDAGAAYYKTCDPDTMLAKVHREANKRYDTRHEAEHFVEGFIRARSQREEYERERRQRS